MNNQQVTTIKNSDSTSIMSGYNGYKIIEVNVSSSTDSLYAVCTPVKK